MDVLASTWKILSEYSELIYHLSNACYMSARSLWFNNREISSAWRTLERRIDLQHTTTQLFRVLKTQLCVFLWSMLRLAYAKFVIATERNWYVRWRTHHSSVLREEERGRVGGPGTALDLLLKEEGLGGGRNRRRAHTKDWYLKINT